MDSFTFSYPYNHFDNYTLNERKPNLQRRERLAMPTISHLLATGFQAVKTHNDKVLKKLESMLCYSIGENLNPLTTESEWHDFMDKFKDDHRLKSPSTDPDKLSCDDLDKPVYYEPYQFYRAQIIGQYQSYNFHGQPKPIASRLLKYTPTERIIYQTKPRRYGTKKSIPKEVLRSMSVHRFSQHNTETKLPSKGFNRQLLAVRGTGLKGYSPKKSAQQTWYRLSDRRSYSHEMPIDQHQYQSLSIKGSSLHGSSVMQRRHLSRDIPNWYMDSNVPYTMDESEIIQHQPLPISASLENYNFTPTFSPSGMPQNGAKNK